MSQNNLYREPKLSSFLKYVHVISHANLTIKLSVLGTPDILYGLQNHIGAMTSYTYYCENYIHSSEKNKL